MEKVYLGYFGINRFYVMFFFLCKIEIYYKKKRKNGGEVFVSF